MSGASDLALSLGGGGARAAYQAGVLRGIARQFPDLSIPFLTGVSAGAINIALLANHVGRFADAAEKLRGLWHDLHYGDVFNVHASSLLARAVRVSARVVVGADERSNPVQGLVDTSPLRRFLHRALDTDSGALTGVPRNLVGSDLRAVALSTTYYATGQTITFFAGRDIEAWERPMRKSVRTMLTVDHVMASAALPLIFPAVQVGDAWYGDGCVRLVAPLAPAVHLGAERILAISNRSAAEGIESNRFESSAVPSPVRVLGVLYNAIFLDHLDQDTYHLERINRLVARLPPEARGELRPVKLLVIRPSRDIGVLANKFEPALPGPLRFLLRRFGTKRERSQDLLSTIMFQPEYLRELIELGERDATARAGELAEFLTA